VKKVVRVAYGTWTQIQYVVRQNERLNNQYPGAGYDYYDIIKIHQSQMPVKPNHKVSYSVQPSYDNFVNYHQMFNPSTREQQDAKREGREVEFFKITLYKQ
jgi:hypothetical protein